MELPTPQAVIALAAFVRERLAEVSGSLLGRRDGAAQRVGMVVVAATAPFATTSYARARLLRQMHASGLLSGEQVRRTRQLLALAGADADDGAPR